MRQTLRRFGAAVGISGSLDSSVVLALCATALGPDRVLGVMMPETESGDDSTALAPEVPNRFGVETLVEDLTDAPTGLGCYTRRDEAIQRVFPKYDSSYQAEMTLPGNVLDSDTLNVFYLTIISQRDKRGRVGSMHPTRTRSRPRLLCCTRLGLQTASRRNAAS